MDDLIVILIMLAFTIIGGIAQARKKKNQAVTSPVNNEGEPKKDFWETLLGEDEVTEDELLHNNVDEVLTPDNTYEPEVSSVETSQMHSKDEIKNSEIGRDKKKNSILDGFSLRKAVVYSEIINRKYS